jgi:hypothetical protein
MMDNNKKRTHCYILGFDGFLKLFWSEFWSDMTQARHGQEI